MIPASSDQSEAAKINDRLAEEIAGFYTDPLGFVLFAYPWGQAGTSLENYPDGPDVWQRAALEDLGRQVRARGFDGVKAVRPIRQAISSGHGIGKSTYQAWIVNWIMSTRPGCRGTITANNATQLDTKTWAAIMRWTRLCITAPWFEINTNRMYFKGHREDWFCAPQSCKKENSEAFAGQHAASSTSFYIFDEDSAVEDVIHEVAEGGLTDGEPMIFRFGNPTRSQGSFYRACFGSERGKWNPVIVDARTARFANKELFDEWAKEYGEDSDFFRVRVRGLPPSAGDLQYIDTKTVSEAQRREAIALPDDALVCGLDVARGGMDHNVFWFRRGQDARTIPPIRIPGEKTKDTTLLVARACEVLEAKYHGRRVDMLFVDGTGIGGPIYDRLVQLGHGARVTEVQFGGEAPEITHGQKVANMRAFMWARGKEWLKRGAIPEDPQLESEITAPGYTHDKRDRVVLESKESLKKRGVASPDHADALFLTFAAPVAVVAPDDEETYGKGGRRAGGTWAGG
jgi:hypothetical protein